MLCTIADIKTPLGLADETRHDTFLTALIAAFSRRADNFTGRVLQDTGAAVTEYYRGGCDLLQLRRYPIVSITSIKEAWDRDWDAATALVADTDYWISDAESGILERLYATWPDGSGRTQVIYRGGFAEPDAVLAAGQTALPADLREAARLQCTMIFQRRDDLGLVGVTFEGGGKQMQQIRLLPEVEDTLSMYRRLSV
jgi:hypothetical protein